MNELEFQTDSKAREFIPLALAWRNLLRTALNIFQRMSPWKRCSGFLLLIAGFFSAQQLRAAPDSYLIPVGDAGVGIVVKLPPDFTVKKPLPRYFYFRKQSRGKEPDVWVRIYIDTKRIVEPTLNKAISPIDRKTLPTLSKPIEWSGWESRILPYRHVYHREAYLENLPHFVRDRIKAKSLQGIVVTISIGGSDEVAVDAAQNWFTRAELK